MHFSPAPLPGACCKLIFTTTLFNISFGPYALPFHDRFLSSVLGGYTVKVIPHLSGRASESSFLILQVMLMLLVRGLNFEEQQGHLYKAE